MFKALLTLNDMRAFYHQPQIISFAMIAPVMGLNHFQYSALLTSRARLMSPNESFPNRGSYLVRNMLKPHEYPILHQLLQHYPNDNV